MSGGVWTSPAVPDAAVSLVIATESYRARPYQDGGGVWTIGYGTTRIAGEPVSADTPAVSEAEARALMSADLAGAARDVASQITVPLRECEAAALISWTYNLGVGNLARSTMRAMVNLRRHGAVEAEMGKWIYTAGKPSLGLLRRRWAEAAVFQGLDAGTAIARAWAEIGALGEWPAIG
jgi:lysozyme